MKVIRREFFHLSKLELVKEGLYQIKDVLVDEDIIGYKETRHQENLVQKKLTKTLGHSSRCLFTLLQHYLCGCGSVLYIEVEVCGGVYGGSSKGNHCLCVGKILASDEENMVPHGVKQLDRALRLFKFFWEIAGMHGVLELQGHIWCVGDRDKTLKYRGNVKEIILRRHELQKGDINIGIQQKQDVTKGAVPTIIP
ncbi:hypothetical protein Syun_030485 [Stephania yunnanensis]|uniref:Uncharacterized protein n=1 Tax=Stephania yunnanensis TaxID=152371 RepID=A0AAP0E7N4_9MAGN